MPRRVGLLLKPDKPQAVEIAAELVPWLRARGHTPILAGVALPAIAEAEAVPERELADRIDLLVILGGDGTLLHGAALVAGNGIPLLGINLGHLGFLASCSPEHAQQGLERALAGEMALEERLRLRCDLHRASGEVVTRYACNDAVVSQGALARLIELEAVLGSTRIARYRADGLIVSTPTGSTAYTLAAGGPIVTPDVRAMVITPICPHTLTNRPVVAPADSRVTVRLLEPAEHVMLTVDGQWGTQLDQRDRVEISAASPPLYLFRPAESYFDVLRQKLRWGER